MKDCTSDEQCRACGPEYYCTGHFLWTKGQCARSQPDWGTCRGSFDEHQKMCVASSNYCEPGTVPHFSNAPDCKCECLPEKRKKDAECQNDDECDSGSCPCKRCGPVSAGLKCSMNANCASDTCVAPDLVANFCLGTCV